jgi:hypothetical protein
VPAAVFNYLTSRVRLRDATSKDYILALVAGFGDEAAWEEEADGSLVIALAGLIGVEGTLPLTLVQDVHARLLGEPYELPEALEGAEDIPVFREMQAHLAPGSWFFVDEQTQAWKERTSAVHFFHADGRAETVASGDLKRQLRDKHMLFR